FATLKPENVGRIDTRLFNLNARTRNDAFGFVFEGTLIVPEAGRYTFFLDSDDGSRLTVDGKKVIEYDGLHRLGTEQQATVELRHGRLPIKLEYFHTSEKLGLSVAWSGPGFARRSLSSSGVVPLSGRDLGQLLQAEGARLLGRERFQAYRQLRREMDK